VVSILATNSCSKDLQSKLWNAFRVRRSEITSVFDGRFADRCGQLVGFCLLEEQLYLLPLAW
jgi:hypothetical protein